MKIDRKILQKLKQLEEFNEAHPYMWNIPHEVGHFLNQLIKSTKRKKAIEVGTSNGYSAIWFSEALTKNDGRLITIERSKEKIKLAKSNLKEVGFEKIVEVKEGNAQEILPGLEEEFDFVFIDTDKSRYVDWIKILEPKLKSGAIVVADNRDAYSGVKSYLKYMKNSSKFTTFRAQIRQSQDDALEVSWKD